MLQETIEDIDKNGDGKINLQEYIGTYTLFSWEEKKTYIRTDILWSYKLKITACVPFDPRGHVHP